MGEWSGKQPWSRSRAVASVGSCPWRTAVSRKLLELEDDVDSSDSIKRELQTEVKCGCVCMCGGGVGGRGLQGAVRFQMALQHCHMDLMFFGFVFRT